MSKFAPEQVERAGRALAASQRAMECLAPLDDAMKAAAISDLMATWLAGMPVAGRSVLVDAIVRGVWDLVEIEDDKRARDA